MSYLLLVPPDKCLLGCIFLIVEYDKHPEHQHQVAKWRQVIEENGGEVELLYSMKLTHILCQTQKHPLVQLVSLIFNYQCYLSRCLEHSAILGNNNLLFMFIVFLDINRNVY